MWLTNLWPTDFWPNDDWPNRSLVDRHLANRHLVNRCFKNLVNTARPCGQQAIGQQVSFLNYVDKIFFGQMFLDQKTSSHGKCSNRQKNKTLASNQFLRGQSNKTFFLPKFLLGFCKLLPYHRHLSNIDCLTACTACLVCFISTVNDHSNK